MRVLGAVLVAVMLAVAVLFAVDLVPQEPVTCEMDLPDFGVVEVACELCPVGESLAGGLVFECESRNVVTTCTTANTAPLSNEPPESTPYSAPTARVTGRVAAGV